MSFGQSAGLLVNGVTVVTSSDGGHRPEYWAERCIAKLINVADSAPPPIRDQAIAFRDAMQAAVLTAIKAAIRSDRTTLVNRLQQAGINDAAALIQSMED